jgi:hypothetical protein
LLSESRTMKFWSLCPTSSHIPCNFVWNNIKRKRKILSFHKTKLHGLSPQATYTDRATAACRRSDCQLLRIQGATWTVWRIPMAVFSDF